MNRIVATVLIVASSTLAPTGTAGAAKAKPPKAATASELATAVKARGLGCAPFIQSSSAGAAAQPPGAPPVGDNGDCVIGGHDASVTVYDRRRDVGRALEAMPTVCRYATAILGPVTFTFLTARNWAISFMTDQLDPTVADKLGATQSEIDCATVR